MKVLIDRAGMQSLQAKTLWNLILSVSGAMLLSLGWEGRAAEVTEVEIVPKSATQVSNPRQPASTVKDWMAQIEEAEIAEITGVQTNVTEVGLELILQTTTAVETPTTAVVDNILTAEIPNAVLILPEGESFEQANPATGVVQIRVTNVPGGQVRVEIVGLEAPPTAKVTARETGLVFAVAPGAEILADTEDASIEITVTANRGDEGYNPSNATTATRTDTPLRDIPQSIQVVPQEVIEDQQANTITDITRNVSGVFEGNTFGGSADELVIRGFRQGIFLRDGFRDENEQVRETANLERVEVLKGPASVLYGTLEPGGVINLVTKKPIEDPLYAAKLTVGSFNTIEPSIDLGGPLNEDKTLLYRFNAFYENRDVFRDFDQGVERIFVSPSLTWKIGDKTDLTFNFEYIDDERPFDRGLVAIGGEIADIPFERVLGELDDVATTESFSANYILEHRFNNKWTLRNSFRFNSADRLLLSTRIDGIDDLTGDLSRFFIATENLQKNYALQTNVVGNFTTGSLEHNLVVGVDLFRFTETGGAFSTDDGGAVVPQVIVG